MNRFRSGVAFVFRSLIIAALTTGALVVVLWSAGQAARAAWALLSAGSAYTPKQAIIFFAAAMLTHRLWRGKGK